MKKILTLISFVALCNLFVKAQHSGDLDLTFGTGGIIITDSQNASDYGQSVCLQSDGKIIVAGYSYIGSGDDFSLVRFNTNGSLDSTFGINGKVITNFGSSSDYCTSVCLQLDGKIIAAGNSNNHFALARYNTNGSLDNTFGTNGKVTTIIGGLSFGGRAVCLQPDGMIIMAGYNNSYDFTLIRLNTNGSLDNSFGIGGIVTTAIGGYDDIGRDVFLQSDGKIILVGESNNGINSDFALVRYNINGSLDNTFGSGGIVITAVGDSDDVSFSGCIQPDGKIIVAGCSGSDTNSDFALVRYNTDGSIDNSFGVSGIVTTDFNSSVDYGFSVTLHSNGKIIVVGQASIIHADFALARYNTDGSIDSTFGTNGKITTTIGNSNSYPNSSILQPDNKIIVAGSANNSDFALARYCLNLTILSNPENKTICKNNNTQFIISTANSISFQWQYYNGSIWSDITDNLIYNGASNDTLQLTNVPVSLDNYLYRCIITDGVNYDTSEVASLKIINLTNDAGTDITFCNDTAYHLNCIGTTNHPEFGALTYAWLPAIGLSSTSIANPTAQPYNNTTYSVTVSDSNGCSVTDAIILTSITPVSITMQPIDYNKCLNSNVTFTVNTSGTTPIYYQWKKANIDISGANNNTYSLNNLILSDEGFYTCEVSNYCHTLITNNTELKVIDLFLNAGANVSICNGDNSVLNATGSSNHATESGTLYYNWSPSTGLSATNVSSPTANPIVNTDYTVTITDQLGCSETDQLNVIVQNVFQNEQICIVLVDSTTSKNLIVWEKTPNVGTAFFVVSKLSGLQYIPLDTIQYDSLSVYIDYSSVPEIHADRYKISVIDTCGIESLLSPYVQTINLGVSQGVPSSTMVLNWNFYEDESTNFVPSWYYIYRGTSSSDIVLLDSVSSAFNSYNDLNIFSLYYYKIAVTKPIACVPTSTFKDMSGPFSQSLSNIEDNGIVDKIINNQSDNSIKIYPNPFNNKTTVEFNTSVHSVYNLVISDITGKAVRTINNIHYNKIEIEKGNLLNGFYTIELKGEKIYRGKIIIN